MTKYSLINILEEQKKYPDTINPPNKKQIELLKIGDYVYIIFSEKTFRERMWLKIVTRLAGNKFVGELLNIPYYPFTNLNQGDLIEFEDVNIIEIKTEKQAADEMKKPDLTVKHDEILRYLDEVIKLSDRNIHPIFSQIISEIEEVKRFLKELEEKMSISSTNTEEGYNAWISLVELFFQYYVALTKFQIPIFFADVSKKNVLKIKQDDLELLLSLLNEGTVLFERLVEDFYPMFRDYHCSINSIFQVKSIDFDWFVSYYEYSTRLAMNYVRIISYLVDNNQFPGIDNVLFLTNYILEVIYLSFNYPNNLYKYNIETYYDYEEMINNAMKLFKQEKFEEAKAEFLEVIFIAAATSMLNSICMSASFKMGLENLDQYYVDKIKHLVKTGLAIFNHYLDTHKEKLVKAYYSMFSSNIKMDYKEIRQYYLDQFEEAISIVEKLEYK